MPDLEFAERIRKHYPLGMTGIFAIGATRRTYILEMNRHAENPGEITDFAAMGAFLQERYFDLAKMYFDLGGQNMIITALSFRSFFERGSDYAESVTPELLRLIDDTACDFYRRENIDPYFIGIDTLRFIKAKSMPSVMKKFATFQKKWRYSPERRRLMWEIASIPLYSFWNMSREMGDEERENINSMIDGIDGISQLWDMLYQRYEKGVYGLNIGTPHFYLGTNASGDLKWRSPMPISLSGGDYVRMFYTPYPTLFITEETLQTIMNDVAFGKRFHSRKLDYKDQYTRKVAEAEYDRITKLSANPANVVGLSRAVKADED